MHSEWVQFINGKVNGANAATGVGEAGDSWIKVEAEKLFEVCEALKNSSHDFNALQVVSGVDYPAEQQIEVNYILASYTNNTELILKVRLPRGDENKLPKVKSVVSLWSGANFQERECYDMLGVHFEGHPDLRRVLCPYDWTGYPLRKDYVVQEKYLDMVVNPAHKMNAEERRFGAEHEYIQGASNSIENYKVDPPPGYKAPAASEESKS